MASQHGKGKKPATSPVAGPGSSGGGRPQTGSQHHQHQHRQDQHQQAGGSGGTESTRPFSSPSAYDRLNLAGPSAAAGSSTELAGRPAAAVETAAASLPVLLRNLSVYEQDATRLAFYAGNDQLVPMPNSDDTLQSGGVLCIEQNTHHVHFFLDLGHLEGRLRFMIYFDPGSDACVFVNFAFCGIALSPVGEEDSDKQPKESKEPGGAKELKEGERVLVGNGGRQHVVHPGLWRVHLMQEHRSTQHLLDFLILRRKFVVSTGPRPSSSATAMLLPPSSGSSTAAATKRKVGDRDDKIPDTQGMVTKKPRTAQIPVAKEQDRTSILLQVPKDGGGGRGHAGPAGQKKKATLMPYPVQASDVTVTGVNPILGLRDGDMAVVQTVHVPAKAAIALAPNDYTLARVTHVADSRATSVFTAEHSSLSQRVVTKVVKTTLDSLPNCARTFMREVHLLSKCNHPNIVKLRVFDGRLFSMVLEELPPNLAGRPTPYPAQDARRVLKDVCSGLAYLAHNGIAHNDIKPYNIAYSRERGAVILDLGFAGDARKDAYGGTPYYIPPEYLDATPKRGLPGDVWATGVCMLFVLGKIALPERSVRVWRFGLARGQMEDRFQMIAWNNRIESEMEKLDQADLVEKLVYNMLKSVEGRITAKDVGRALA